MYEQLLPIEEWKAKKQAERNDTHLPRRKSIAGKCRMASALPTISTRRQGGGLAKSYHIW